MIHSSEFPAQAENSDVTVGPEAVGLKTKSANNSTKNSDQDENVAGPPAVLNWVVSLYLRQFPDRTPRTLPRLDPYYQDAHPQYAKEHHAPESDLGVVQADINLVQSGGKEWHFGLLAALILARVVQDEGRTYTLGYRPKAWRRHARALGLAIKEVDLADGGSPTVLRFGKYFVTKDGLANVSVDRILAGPDFASICAAVPRPDQEAVDKALKRKAQKNKSQLTIKQGLRAQVDALQAKVEALLAENSALRAKLHARNAMPGDPP